MNIFLLNKYLIIKLNFILIHSTYSQQQQKHRLLQFQIELTAIAINQSIPEINFS